MNNIALPQSDGPEYAGIEQLAREGCEAVDKSISSCGQTVSIARHTEAARLKALVSGISLGDGLNI